MQRRALRATLRTQLLHVRRVARVLERSVVGMPRLVALPHRVAGEQALLDAARGAVTDVTPYKEHFLQKGLPVDFLDGITASIQTISTVRDAAAAARRRRAAARGVLHQSIVMGDDAVTCIDAIVRQACANDPVNGQATLTAWNAIVPPRTRAARVATHAGVVVIPATQGTADTAVTPATATSTAPSTGGASA